MTKSTLSVLSFVLVSSKKLLSNLRSQRIIPVFSSKRLIALALAIPHFSHVGSGIFLPSGWKYLQAPPSDEGGEHGGWMVSSGAHPVPCPTVGSTTPEGSSAAPGSVSPGCFCPEEACTRPWRTGASSPFLKVHLELSGDQTLKRKRQTEKASDGDGVPPAMSPLSPQYPAERGPR